MRALAIVGLKLMGVSSIYRAVGIISSITNALAVFSNPHPGINCLWLIANAVAIFVIDVLFALVLLFRTEWIVAKLQIPDEPLTSSVSASELLRVGLVMIGVIAIMGALSESGSILFNMIQNMQSNARFPQGLPLNVGPVVKALLELLLAFVVIGKSRRIASRVFSGS
jgi:hypothetical protein